MDGEIEQIFIKPDIAHLKVEVECEQESSDDPYRPPEHVFNVKSEDGSSLLFPDSINEIHKTNSVEIVGKVYENGKINRLQCPQCDNTFKNRANLKQHLKFVHSSEDDIVECDKCYRTFKSVGHLRSHNHSVHAEEKEVTCEHCGKVFSNKKRLNNHIFYSHPEPEESVNCSVCSKSFKRRYNLKIHMRLVHPSEDRSVQCPQCDKKFKVDMLLQRHIKWSHPQDGMMYRCPECGRTLPSIACFRKHMQNVHSGSQDAVCKICSKVFKTVKTLNRHERIVHGGAKVEAKPGKVGDIPCSQCDKKFTTNTALFWHFERHHSENKRSNACQICNKELSDQGSLKRHLEMVHSFDPVNCPICSKTFKSHMNLQRHIRVTHAPPEAAQKCDICNKTFKCSMHLRIHVNAVHSTEGIFTCDICDKEFSSKKYMLKHKKTHVDVKLFPCGICSKMFKCVNDVKKHTKRVHLKTPVKTEHLEAESTEAASYTDNMEATSSGALNCSKCGDNFENETELHSHIINCGELPALAFVKVEIQDM
ncbi:zinc finger protein OZF-like isoform X2 [Leguminivora glycinivorella]|nr:zinc finger protein OZF-like isoform X2 [Leguminivora glycinivorella]